MKLLQRPKYLEKVLPFVQKPVIKVITGIRRSGKSTFLELLAEHLKQTGISDEQIIFINKELVEFDFINDYQSLYSYIEKHKTTSTTFAFLDEVQQIAGWERAVASLLAKGGYDIYITGSNSAMLSSELTTLLAGRYVMVHILPLGFDELVEVYNTELSTEEIFSKYLQLGGMPMIHTYKLDKTAAYQYISSIYDTVIIKDVLERYNIRNVRLLQDLTKFVLMNIGNPFSANSVAKYLKSQRIKVGVETIQNYLSYLESVFLFYRVPRADLQGKKVLEFYEKYYVSDIGFHNAIVGFSDSRLQGLLENIVFLKLKQTGANIYVGKIGNQEIDFIAEKGEQRIYIQVSYSVANKETYEREISALKKVRDSFPKYLITMDKLPVSYDSGIKRMNLIDFLLQEEVV